MYKKLKKKKIFNIPFSAVNMKDVIDISSNEIIKKSNNCRQIVFVNVFSTILALKDLEFMKICNMAFLTIPDGKPIIWISKLLNKPLIKRISGPDFMREFLKVLVIKKKHVYFLGGNKKSLSDLIKNLQNLYPSIKIAGGHSPPFGIWPEEKNKKMINIINKSKADVLFVGVSSPKQDKWIFSYKNQLKIKLAIGVGAAFDFFSGKTKRAPEWMQEIGLEWFYRLIQEPGRMWKRYLIGNIIFIWIALKEIIKVRIFKE